MACAHGSASPGRSDDPQPAQGPADDFQPPQLLTRGTHPSLEVPVTSSTSRAPVRITIQVMVTPEGRADMSTLKVSGMGTAGNTDTIRQWVQDLMFKPARRNGELVAGEWRTSLQARAVVVRTR
jgi:hypothetical protein